MARQAIIYGLADPRTGELRYVGKTVKSLKARLREHMSRARSGGREHRSCWIRATGAPDAFEIERVEGDGCESERHHIAYFRSLGCRLVNHTAGGEGRLGDRHSVEARAKMSAAQLGRKRSAEQRARMSAAIVGRPVSEATREKLRVIFTGRRAGPQPADLVERRAAALRGRKIGTGQVTALRTGHANYFKQYRASRLFETLVGGAKWHLSR